jgi:hypothetical protein
MPHAANCAWHRKFNAIAPASARTRPPQLARGANDGANSCRRAGRRSVTCVTARPTVAPADRAQQEHRLAALGRQTVGARGSRHRRAGRVRRSPSERHASHTPGAAGARSASLLPEGGAASRSGPGAGDHGGPSSRESHCQREHRAAARHARGPPEATAVRRRTRRSQPGRCAAQAGLRPRGERPSSEGQPSANGVAARHARVRRQRGARRFQRENPSADRGPAQRAPAPPAGEKTVCRGRSRAQTGARRGVRGAPPEGGTPFSEGKPTCFRGKNPYFGRM